MVLWGRWGLGSAPARAVYGWTAGRGPPKLPRPAVAELEDLSPSYFALVMATGIVAVGCHLMGPKPLAVILFALNGVAYVTIWALTLLRLRLFPRRVLEDLTSHQRGLGFLTVVAATGVLGTEMILIAGEFALAVALLALAVFLWLALNYTIFTALTIKREKPSLAEGISGTWLLAVVATQSIAVLTALLAAHWGQPLRLHANFVALSMWLWGGMLYIWIISLIFYRYTFFRFEPDDLAPPYWINMGAMAISVLAGSLLVDNSRQRRRALPALAAALPGGLHGLLLGDRHLVDPDHRDPRRSGATAIAACRSIRPAVLGRRLPAGDVRGGHLPDGGGAEARVPGPDPPGLPRPRPGRLAGDFPRPAAETGARLRAAPPRWPWAEMRTMGAPQLIELEEARSVVLDRAAPLPGEPSGAPARWAWSWPRTCAASEPCPASTAPRWTASRCAPRTSRRRPERARRLCGSSASRAPGTRRRRRSGRARRSRSRPGRWSRPGPTRSSASRTARSRTGASLVEAEVEPGRRHPPRRRGHRRRADGAARPAPDRPGGARGRSPRSASTRSPATAAPRVASWPAATSCWSPARRCGPAAIRDSNAYSVAGARRARGRRGLRRRAGRPTSPRRRARRSRAALDGRRRRRSAAASRSASTTTSGARSPSSASSRSSGASR